MRKLWLALILFPFCLNFALAQGEIKDEWQYGHQFYRPSNSIQNCIKLGGKIDSQQSSNCLIEVQKLYQNLVGKGLDVILDEGMYHRSQLIGASAAICEVKGGVVLEEATESGTVQKYCLIDLQKLLKIIDVTNK